MPLQNNQKDSIDRVPANYSEFAKSRDHVDPQSLTYSNTNNTGPFAKRLRGKPDPNQDLVDIDEPEGCIFEADEGVPILLLITKLQSKELQVPWHFSFSLLCGKSSDLASLGQHCAVGFRVLLYFPLQQGTSRTG